MIKNVTIDLHMHSTVSDGTDTPSEIVRCVMEHGIGLFSLTDHDAIKGCDTVKAHLAEKKAEGMEVPDFISGIEFSCKDELGKYHILGYGYDAATAPIRNVVEKGHSLRMKKVLGRLEFLKEEFGFEYSQEDLDELLSLDNPGKPHIGNLMVKYGYADDKEVAIRSYIDKKKFGSVYIRPEEAIKGILGSGGIPVLAHPVYGSGDQFIIGEELEERVTRLMGFGLQGVEAYYSGFTAPMIKSVLLLASRYELCVTAGSDYHGSNKLVVLGDTNFKGERPKEMERFLEEVKIR